MSKICIGVLSDDGLDAEHLRRQIKELADLFGLAVFFELTYNEPFLSAFANNKYFLFSIADSYMHDNCEMFLLPDSCLFNGKSNLISFSERMKCLEGILNKLLENISKIDLFIGDSGTRYSEFETYSISVAEFLCISSQLNSINSLDLHIIVTRGQGDGVVVPSDDQGYRYPRTGDGSPS